MDTLVTRFLHLATEKNVLVVLCWLPGICTKKLISDLNYCKYVLQVIFKSTRVLMDQHNKVYKHMIRTIPKTFARKHSVTKI